MKMKMKVTRRGNVTKRNKRKKRWRSVRQNKQHYRKVEKKVTR